MAFVTTSTHAVVLHSGRHNILFKVICRRGRSTRIC